MNKKLMIKAQLSILVLSILTTSCSLFADVASPEVDEISNTIGSVPIDEVEEPKAVELLLNAPEVEVSSSYESDAGYEVVDSSMPVSAAGKSEGYDSADVSPPDRAETSEITVDQQYNLRAGSVDDNERWDDYLLYRLRFAETFIRVREIDVTERHIIHVKDEQGLPVLGARISIHDEQGQLISELMSYSNGRALFFPKAHGRVSQSYDVQVEKDGQTASFTMKGEVREHEVVLNARPASNPVRLDVHFLIDATGSMSDEIYQLRNNMITISQRIHALASHPDVRFGMTTYRDRGDIFVSETLDFTPDIHFFTQELGQVYADGGGDYPESLNEGLHDAIHMPEWRVDETISLIFLIADAPPHLDYPDDFDYAEQVFEAAERGIKIFPLASSGLDDQGEFIFRQLAQITSAKFLFLTYGADGEPGSDTTHHVDDYSVLSLDQLVVRIVEEELANLAGIGSNSQ